MYRQFDLVQQAIVSWSGLVDNRNVHLAYAAFWYNYSVLLMDSKKRENIPFLNALMGFVAEGDSGTASKHAESIGQLLHAFGNLLVGGGKQWVESFPLVAQFRKAVQSYPKTFEGAYEVRRAVQQINRL